MGKIFSDETRVLCICQEPDSLFGLSKHEFGMPHGTYFFHVSI